jgi:hypothetical protein
VAQYVKNPTWADEPAGGTPITAVKLNNVETGIFDAHTRPVFATTLPGSPVDGEQVVLVDSLTTPTWAWVLRYLSAGTSGKKWVCLGGVPRRAETNPAASLTIATWIAGAGVTPGLVGQYVVYIAASVIAGASATVLEIGTGVGTTPTVPYTIAASAGTFMGTLETTVITTGTSDVISVLVRQTSGTAGTLSVNRIHVIPAFLA